MITLKMEWVKSIEQYQSGEVLLVNTKYPVAWYEWNAGRSKEEKDKDWRGHISLPARQGMVYKDIFSSDADEVKAKLEEMVLAWFSQALGQEVTK